MKLSLALLLLLAGCKPDMTAVLQPLGLRTQPNKYGQYPPGACSKVQNVAMRDPGVISSLPDTRAFSTNCMSAGYTIRKLFPFDSSLLAVGDGAAGARAFQWVTLGSNAAITMPVGFGSLGIDTGICSVTKPRNRSIVTTNRGPLIFDSEGDTEPRVLGLTKPSWGSIATATDARSLADGYGRSYRAIFRREQADGYIVTGAVSNSVYYKNSSGSTVDLTLRVRWPGSSSPIVAGDSVEVYRTRDQLIGTSTGATYNLAAKYTITATDIVNDYADVRDLSLDSTLGVDLYTNPGVVTRSGEDGLQNMNDPPPLADDVLTFKGYTFYVSRRLPAYLKVKINAMVGLLSTTAERLYGIGRRAVTLDIANGSPTAINLNNTNGIVAGQYISGTGIPANTTISAVVGTTVTLSANATATTAGLACNVYDRMQVTTQTIVITSHSDLLQDLAHAEVLSETELIAPIAAGPVFLTTANVDGPEYFFRGQRYSDYLSAPLDVRATNGQNYSPPLPAMSATGLTGSYDERFNRFHWSKLDQPEAVSPLSFKTVGNGKIYRFVAVTDRIYAFCSDGLYQITGDAGEWRVDPVDLTLVLAARGAVDTLGDTAYAYTNRGLVSIAGGAVTEISNGIIGDAATLPGAAYTDTWDTFLNCDELHKEVRLAFHSGSSTLAYVWNTLSKSFVTYVNGDVSASVYSRSLRSMVFALVSSLPDTTYFHLDTTATRLLVPDVRFQPLSFGSPAEEKEFVEVEWIFEGALTAITMIPSYNGVDYTTVPIPANTIESHVMVPVPRAAPAYAASLRPGFTLSSGAATNLWSLRGFDVNYRNIGGGSVR